MQRSIKAQIDAINQAIIYTPKRRGHEYQVQTLMVIKQGLEAQQDNGTE